MDEALRNLEKYWGFDSFRPGQEQVISAVLEGRDSVVLFPTGGGKSLCYQLPATLLEGMTLVISPLIALMQDQVEQLQKTGIRASFINSMIPGFEAEQRLLNARNNMYRLLYISPERLGTLLWEQMVPDLNISLVAVDEAHCISQWGHDFRPAYRSLRPSLQHLRTDTRWMALTATATPEVRDDIIRNLELENPEVVATGFERPNLQWWVNTTEKKKERLLKAVQRGVKKGSGIIYMGTRKNCDTWASRLSGLKIDTRAYHAGLDKEVRNDVQKGWLDGTFPVVAATNAFGMGIDKPDCRFVIHYDMPYTLEAYYQEAGRAGRDGKKAFPLLFYRESDYHKAKARIFSSYPDLDTLRKLYDALCDELNLATGSEQEQPEPVETEALSRRSGLKTGVVDSGLRVLERLEVIEVARQSEARLGIRFHVTDETLAGVIESAKPSKALFLDHLFRQFGPMAFRKLFYLDLPYLEVKLNTGRNGILKAVQILAEEDQLLEYRFLDREPMIRIRETRAGRLPATRPDVEGYRDVLLKKLEYVKGYAETEGCRERYLRNYFGETGVTDCGHCDNCTRKPEKLIINSELLSSVRAFMSEPKTVREIAVFTGLALAQVNDLLGYLIRENWIKKSETADEAWLWTG